MAHSIRIPAPTDGRLVGTERAAKWLEVSPHTYERMAAATDWLRPVKVGRRSMWCVLDVAIFGMLIARRREAPTDANASGGASPEAIPLSEDVSGEIEE